jgi:hypothetical protein
MGQNETKHGAREGQIQIQSRAKCNNLSGESDITVVSNYGAFHSELIYVEQGLVEIEQKMRSVVPC